MWRWKFLDGNLEPKDQNFEKNKNNLSDQYMFEKMEFILISVFMELTY